MQLSRDIYTEIQSHLPRRDQPAFRQAARQTSQSYFDWQTQCCYEPTSSEIYKWLLELSNDMKAGKVQKSKNKTKLRGYAYDKNFIILSIVDIDNPEDFAHISVRFSNGEIGATDKNYARVDKYDGWLSDLFKNKKLRLEGEFKFEPFVLSWQLIRNILLKRTKCITERFSADKCLIDLLTTYLPQTVQLKEYDKYRGIFRVFASLYQILKPEVMNIFVEDFRQQFNITTPIDIYDKYFLAFLFGLDKRYVIDRTQLELWLRQWLSKLHPADLRPDITIRY